MKLNWTREILPVALLIAMIVTTLHYYPLLPNLVPSHFNIEGKANGWMPKDEFFLIMGSIFVLMYLLLTFLPFIDPFKKKVESRFGVILLLRDVMLVFDAAVFGLVLQAASSGVFHANFVGIAVGLLFIIFGNYMPKMPQNWFMGIRSPWTISSEVVWKKTHILGGWLFTLAGIAWILCVFLKMNNLVPALLIIIVALTTYVYSFVIYKKLQQAGFRDAAK